MLTLSLKSWLGWAWLVFLFTAALPVLAATNTANSGTYAYTVQPFSAVSIEGPFNVQILGGSNQYSVQVTGTAATIHQVQIQSQNGTLSISYYSKNQLDTHKIIPALFTIRLLVPKLYSLQYHGSGDIQGQNLQQPLSLSLYTHGNVQLTGQPLNLQALQVNGNGNIELSGLQSSNLDISYQGSSSVKLLGAAALNNLRFNGDGSLSLQWSNSRKVEVTAKGTGHIALAGVTDLLVATINNQVYLDAKYLRAKQGFIKTTDSARADVWVKDALSSLATGNSNIYYYRDAPFVGAYMRSPAASLRMTGIPLTAK